MLTARRLNEMKTPAWVKILDRPEMDALGLDRFENLVLLRRGSFADYMSEADVLLVDSLGGSPVYEAMATDRPILLYAGMENQQWDPAMMAAQTRRALGLRWLRASSSCCALSLKAGSI